MWQWFKRNWKTLFSGLGTMIVGFAIGRYLPTKDNASYTSHENTNLGQQQAVFNQGDVNEQTYIQSQGIPPHEVVKGFKDLGKTEHMLEETELEKQQLQKELELYRTEDKDIREALARAENNEKYELTAVIMHEYIEGQITKDEALKLSDMVNKAYWKDLKSFFDNKNINVDKDNHQSLIFSGIFEPKDGRGFRGRERYTFSSPIKYRPTADGNKLHEIANKYLPKQAGVL